MAREIVVNRWLAAGFFVLALACRFLNAPYAFDGGKPRLAPVDELYHWQRMAHPAAHFPRALEHRPDAGGGGAFGPRRHVIDALAGRGALSARREAGPAQQ